MDISLSNIIIILVILAVIILIIKIKLSNSLKKGQMALIYDRDKYLYAITKGNLSISSNYNTTYIPTNINSLNRKYVIIIDKNKENTQSIHILIELSPTGYAEVVLELYYKINPSVVFNENFGKVFDSLITEIKYEFVKKANGMSADDGDKIGDYVEEIKNSIIFYYTHYGIEIIRLEDSIVYFMHSDEDMEFYKSSIEQDEISKRNNM